MKRSKRYRAALAKVDKNKVYTYGEALPLMEEVASSRFDETVEAAVHLSLKKGHTVRDTLVFPHSFAKEKKILVFVSGGEEEESKAKEAGAAYAGSDDLIDKIRGGWLDFDVCVATPEMMKKVGRLGPILGRRGLMPNPRTHTVTSDIVGALGELRKGRTDYRADKMGVVHISVGKVSMGSEQVEANLTFFVESVLKKRPADLKGEFVKSVSISSTMGPGIRVLAK